MLTLLLVGVGRRCWSLRRERRAAAPAAAATATTATGTDAPPGGTA